MIRPGLGRPWREGRNLSGWARPDQGLMVGCGIQTSRKLARPDRHIAGCPAGIAFADCITGCRGAAPSLPRGRGRAIRQHCSQPGASRAGARRAGRSSPCSPEHRASGVAYPARSDFRPAARRPCRRRSLRRRVPPHRSAKQGCLVAPSDGCRWIDLVQCSGDGGGH